MEEDETHTWQARAAQASSHGSTSRKSLNENPHNLRAEELAIEYCKQGAAVSKEWTEGEMVSTFGGGEIPGTPDGMFEDAAGSLTCVQVVRVPLLPSMCPDEVAETLYDTVLTKVVKSQIWMKSTGIVPHDFVIFCWLPPVGAFKVFMEPTSEAMLWTEALIWNVRAGGWPFSLKLMVPDEPEALFPTTFGQNRLHRVRKDFWVDLSFTFDPADFEIDDEPMEWDLFAYEEEIEVEADMTRAGDTKHDTTELRQLVEFLIRFLEERSDVEEPLRHARFGLLEEDEEEDEEDRRVPIDAFVPHLVWQIEVVLFPDAARKEARDRPLLQGKPWWGAWIVPLRVYACVWPDEARSGARDRPPFQGLPWWGAIGIRAKMSCDDGRWQAKARDASKQRKVSFRRLLTMGLLLAVWA